MADEVHDFKSLLFDDELMTNEKTQKAEEITK